MKEKIYIGIDPDLRKLNAAIVSDEKELLAVFLRRNKEGTDDEAVVNAARASCRLVEDVIAYLVDIGGVKEITTIVESQSMQHAIEQRKRGKKIDLDDIRRTGQVAGCLLGAFSNMSNNLILVQPSLWKGQVPKNIHHARIYGKLGIKPEDDKKMKNIYPCACPNNFQFMYWSKDKTNPGDFADINDSIGLALWGLERRNK